MRKTLVKSLCEGIVSQSNDSIAGGWGWIPAATDPSR